MQIRYAEGSGGKSLLITISGDCDMYSAQDFFLGVTAKMNGNYASVFIDFSEVMYLDSSGVGAIIKILKSSKEKNIDLKFRGITGTPRKVLRMSNILNIITEEI
jgi:anti-sigma B factor antagonist